MANLAESASKLELDPGVINYAEIVCLARFSKRGDRISGPAVFQQSRRMRDRGRGALAWLLSGFGEA